MTDETRSQFVEIADNAIDDAGCVPCESLEDFKNGLKLIIELLEARLGELDPAPPSRK